MHSRFFKAVALVSFAPLFAASAGLAQDSALTPTAPPAAVVGNEFDGWTPTGVIAGQFNLDQTQDVVGQTSGTGKKFGINLAIGARYKLGLSRWVNTLDANAGFASIPAVPRLVKTSDEFKFVSMYTYSFELPQPVGPYARFSLDTAMFPGYAESAADKNFHITSADGSSRNVTLDKVLLTNAFAPITTRESVGGFITLTETKELSSMARLGFGLEQSSQGKGNYKIASEVSANVVELNEIKNYKVGGIEGGAIAASALGLNTALSAEGDFLYPLIISDDVKGNKQGFDLLSWEVKAKLATKVVSWMSASYEFKAKKQPLVQTKIQLQNILALQAMYTFL